MKTQIEALGQSTLRGLLQVGRFPVLLFSICSHGLSNLRNFPHIVREIYYFGVSSLSIVVFCSLFIGLVLGLQAYHSLIAFRAEASLGALVGISILREIGPVLSAILFASSTGSAMTSEIALLKTTEQLDALEVMGIDPLERIIGPRFWAGFFSMPCLAMIGNAAAIFGAYSIAVLFYHLDANTFWESMNQAISISNEILGALIKSTIFGVFIVMIAIYNGLNAKPTASGSLKATNQTVVWSSVGILGIDFVLTVFLFMG
ncbi:MAG: MlaE family lipid ABC transporter permease subunit [Neisseriaceae bacterium]